MKKLLPILIVASALLVGSCMASKNCKNPNNSCEKIFKQKSCCKK
jgi:hypothetical protein